MKSVQGTQKHLPKHDLVLECHSHQIHAIVVVVVKIFVIWRMKET